MPAWWGRKSNKTKEDQINHNTTLFSDLNTKKSYFISEINDKYVNNKRSPRSLDDAGRAILSPNLRGSSSGLDGDKKVVVGHPLPRPNSINGLQQQPPSMSHHYLNNGNQQSLSMSHSYLNNGNGNGNCNGGVDQSPGSNNRPVYPTEVRSSESQGHGVGLLITTTSGSASVSSVSSSGSNCDEPPFLHDQNQSGNFSGRGRSPGPGSRAPTAATSPIHPRLASLNLESPPGRQEEGRSQGHPLPLPPSSPTSPSSLPHGRAGGFTESTHKSLMWMKGRLLGRGTFGHVYLGFNSEGGHMCAIKEVRIVSDDQNSGESLKQLNQEINLLSQLSHPNIVRYYGSDLAGDTLSVYLEYVSGGSIHKLLQEYGPFKEPVIQNYTRQILSGLAYLHSRTTVHRDIKGANILVDPTGEIKLADFGMAKHITSCNSVLSFKGSPYWMAPEVVMNKNGHNLAVDIWSLGCTIIEMATAKPPWSQYEGVAAIFKIGNSKDMPEIPDFLSSDAKSFLHLCLQRDPADRPLATALLDHPFVKGQSVGRPLNINPTNDAASFSFDGRRKPQPLDIHPRRKSISSYDTEQMRKPGLMIWEARDNPRSITSLPVSPSSSPLHRLAPSSKSGFLSPPPHPSYAWPGQSNYNPNDHSISPTRRRAGYTLDPRIESTLFKTQTHSGSPSMRLL